ncbi:FxsA family protein [Vibrio harveyi]|nr:FxsA family protein [Vibrio harveyi]
MLITAFVGASLVRSQGIQTLMSVQGRLEQGELPAQQIFEGVIAGGCRCAVVNPRFHDRCIGYVGIIASTASGNCQIPNE